MKHILFDLDGTLIVNLNSSAEKLYPYNFKNFTFVEEKILGCEIATLCTNDMAKVFFNLLALDNNFKIGFLTGSTYPKQEVLPLLEKAYGLPEHILSSSCYVYYNRNDFSEKRNMKKGVIMGRLYKQGIISRNSLLVDNSSFHIHSAKRHGFGTIKANSWRETPEYPIEIQRIIKNQVRANSRTRSNSISMCNRPPPIPILNLYPSNKAENLEPISTTLLRSLRSQTGPSSSSQQPPVYIHPNKPENYSFSQRMISILKYIRIPKPS